VSKRNLYTWPSRLNHKIERTSGTAGLILAIGTVVGFYVKENIFGIINAVLLLSLIAYLAWDSFPPKMKLAQDCLGIQMSLKQLGEIHPPLLKLAVIGASQTGKSTFLSSTQHAASPERTNNVYAEILAIAGNPPKYIALLDGDGSEYIQQFDILREADIIFVFTDHNSQSNSADISESRLSEQDRFIKQIQSVIKNRSSLPAIHFLLNKRDLWERGPHAEKLALWHAEHAERWSSGNFSSEFSSSHHSNRNTEDTSLKMAIIKNLISKRTSQ
jgi:hypothetical protein